MLYLRWMCSTITGHWCCITISLISRITAIPVTIRIDSNYFQILYNFVFNNLVKKTGIIEVREKKKKDKILETRHRNTFKT